MDLSKLTLEIFSKLEHKWLSDYENDLPNLHHRPRKTRLLSIDGALGPDGLVAAHSLVQLETHLQTLSGNPSARIAHYFDLVAGTGVGGLLAALLTVSDDPSSFHPTLSAAEAVEFLFHNLPELFRRPLLRRRYSGRSFEAVLKRVFKGMTLRDTCRPLLVPCYDLGSSAPFVFSRADAAESTCFDFELWAVCRATAATPGMFRPFVLKSVDGKTTCMAVDGGVVMNNPAAAAVTHVLHNRRDFPDVHGIGDLMVLSIGNGRVPPAVAVGGGSDGRDCSRHDVMKIVLRGVSDTVDQILGNAFCWNRTDYVRIQANGLEATTEEMDAKAKKDRATGKRIRAAGERMLKEKGLEALPFGGKRLLQETNGERLEAFARRLVAPVPVEKPLLLLPAADASPIEAPLPSDHDSS